MTDDVVVVGGGLEGYLAALSAAQRDPDAAVRLVELSPERFRHESGLVDVLGYRDGLVTDPLAAVAGLPDTHPYRRVGVDTVRDALDTFDDVTGDQYAGGGTEANALVATPMGNVLPASRYPTGMAPGLVSDDRKLLFVGFEEVSAFDAYLASDRLGDVAPFDTSGVSVSFPVEASDRPVTRAFARQLDENAKTHDGVPVRRALADTVRSYLDIEPRVGFPAVLGESNHEAVRTDLADRLQAEIFEVPLGEPSVPGMRLRRLLVDALDDVGVQFDSETSVVDVETTDDAVEAITVQQGDETATHEAVEFVLATGGLGSGGLTSDRKTVNEPLFGCHVEHPNDRSAWVADAPLDDQPFARFGLDIDGRLRPLSARGDPVYGNLRAAGQVLGGTNAPAEKSQAGIAVATGHAAGVAAVERW